MYINESRLPHLLPPEAYTSDDQHTREQDNLLRDSWHVVCTTRELACPGDFVTATLLGQAVHVRNFAGELRALSNVCGHRHSLISGDARGNSPTMKCQYHGWEYGADGCTRRIPAAHNFRPMQQGCGQIACYRVATCGQLVFVSLAESGSSLIDFLGDFEPVIARHFSENHVNSLAWDYDVDANWKVVIENSLEAYHVPCVHSETFREDPGEDRSTHELFPQRTSFATDLPFSPHSKIDLAFQRCERWFLGMIGASPSGRYSQHHLFPNLMFSFTDTISLAHCVIPTGPTSCRCVTRQLGIGGKRSGFFCRRWAKLGGWLTKRVLQEDAQMFPQIQQGLSVSQQPGMLGRCEERIHAFQSFIQSNVTASEQSLRSSTEKRPSAA